MSLKTSYQEDVKIIKDRRAWIFTILLTIVLFSLPFYISEYFIYILTIVSIYSIGVVGQNILIGYTGQMSLGQSGFLACGAYTFAHLVRLGIPLPLSLIFSGLFSGIVGVIIGLPSLRLKGPYLAIATLGFALASYQVLVNFESISGGRMGFDIPKVFWADDKMEIYFLSILLTYLFFIIGYNLVKSHIGRAFQAIRDSDVAAESMGINLTKYKLLAFAISSFYTGSCGALHAYVIGHIEPEMFTILESIQILAAIIIGGVGTIVGSIFGSAFVIIVPQYFAGLKEFVPVIFGVSIALVLIFEPLGIYGRWMKIKFYFMFWPFR